MANASPSDHFDPNQPRVPAGHPGGGQWTSFGALLGGGDVASRGASVSSEPGRASSSRLPSDATELAFSGSDANVLPRAPGVRRLFKTQPLRPAEALALYELLSAQDGPDGQAVLHLKAYGFKRDGSGNFNFTHAFVERLTREQVARACKRFDEVQRLLSRTYDEVVRDNPKFNAGQIGSRVHLLMKERINSDSSLNDVLRAEVSYLEGEKEPPPSPANKNHGRAGSIRPDIREKSIGAPEESIGAALERLTPETVCFYELTTGQRDMGPARSIKIGQMTKDAFPNDHFTHFIVLQMRPSSWKRRR